MNDPREPFELDLKARLEVNPSSGLQARIRARAYAEPQKRIPWFTLSAGLATAAIAVAFAALYIQRQPEITRTVPPVAAPPVAVAELQKPKVIEKVIEEPIRRPIQITFVPLESDEIKSPVLRELELTNSVLPIPKADIPAVARLESISLEPFILPVRTLEE